MLDRVKVFDASTIDAALYNIQTALKDNLYKISATAENQLSSDSTTQKTATEASIIEAKSNIRNSERIDNVTDFTIDVAETLIKVLQKFMSKKVSVKYADAWAEFTKENIKGNHNVRINIGDTIKPNTAEDRARMSQVLVETINAVDTNNIPIVNRREIVKMYYEKYGFTKNDIDKLMTQAQPIPPIPNQEGGQLTGQPVEQEGQTEQTQSNLPPGIAELLGR